MNGTQPARRAHPPRPPRWLQAQTPHAVPPGTSIPRTRPSAAPSLSLSGKPAVPSPPAAACSSGASASPGSRRRGAEPGCRCAPIPSPGGEAGAARPPVELRRCGETPEERTYHCSGDPSRRWRCCILGVAWRGGCRWGGSQPRGDPERLPGTTRSGPGCPRREGAPGAGCPRLARTGRRRGRRLRRESKFLLPRLPVMSRLPLLRGWARAWP